jgi:hypothetical protein
LALKVWKTRRMLQVNKTGPQQIRLLPIGLHRVVLLAVILYKFFSFWTQRTHCLWFVGYSNLLLEQCVLDSIGL